MEAINCTNSELSTFLQGLAEESLATCSSGMSPLGPSKLSHTANKSCQRGRRTELSPGFQFSLMFPNSTGGGSGDSSTLSPAGSPSLARTSPQRVKEKGLPAHVRAFGSKCSELLARFGLVLSSRKTRLTCEVAGLLPSSKDLPAWGMMRNGVYWELGTSVRLIEETECGSLLPTPTAMDHRDMSAQAAQEAEGKGQQVRLAGRVKWPTPTICGNHRQKGQGTSTGDGLATAVNLWPTPVADDSVNRKAGKWNSRGEPKLSAAVKLWPTPQSNDHRPPCWSGSRRALEMLPTAVGGQLNPSWVAWLMGWPTEWSALEPLEMDKFRQWLRSHGRY